MAYTITYSPRDRGWTSFHSFEPEWMVTMNNFLYTFKNGNLYKHNTNQVRNNYYGSQYSSTITTIINDEPIQPKSFKTIATNSSSPWSVQIDTDMESGMISVGDFDKKENVYYAYIRRNPDDQNISLTSAQGLGNVVSINSGVLTFGFSVDSIISNGDILYSVNNGVLQLIGIVLGHVGTQISVTLTGSYPTTGAFIMYMKNSVAESFPVRGTYLSAKLTNTNNTYADIYFIESDAFKSYP